MNKKYLYRFIKVEWSDVAEMNEDLNNALHAHEEVIGMHADGDDVIVLVKTTVKEKK